MGHGDHQQQSQDHAHGNLTIGLDTADGVNTLHKDNAEAAFELETDYGILIRCGLHCAPSAHKTLDTFPRGTVRFSLGFASTERDVDTALAAIRAVSED
ncbi:MAG: aminotransferase class V-fold PLP-dependent enzyme [Oscillospiraceae bacterium]